LGCFPYDTASSAQRVGISLVKGKRVSMVGKKPTGFVGNRRDLSVGVFPQRYCKYCTTCWHFPCKGKESKYGWQASRLNSSETDGTCPLGCFPNDTASTAQRVGISLAKGKRVSMVGKKPTGFVGNRRDLLIWVFPQRYWKWSTTGWAFSL
jgi:hypothetical protein